MHNYSVLADCCSIKTKCEYLSYKYVYDCMYTDKEFSVSILTGLKFEDYCESVGFGSLENVSSSKQPIETKVKKLYCTMQ